MTSPFAFFGLIVGQEKPDEPGAAKTPCQTRRLLVSNDVQQALSREFEQQAAALSDPGLRPVPYDPGYKLEPREVFVVDATLAPPGTNGRATPQTLTLPPSLVAAVRAPQAAEIVDADVLRDGGLRSLCAARGTEADLMLIFQLFQQGQVIRRGNWRYLHVLDDARTFTSLDSDCLALANSAAAVYQGGSLYFRSAVTVRRFLDLDPLFHAATNRELKHFFGGALWAPVNLPVVLAQADDVIRRKVAEIEWRHNLTQVTPRVIQEVARRHDIALSLDAKGRLAVPAEKRDLKQLVRLLADDLLESPLTHWTYWSNSKRLAESKVARRAAARGSRAAVAARRPASQPGAGSASARGRVATARSAHVH